MASEGRASVLLAAGAAAGLAAALISALGVPDAVRARGGVAQVGEATIAAEDFERALAGLAAEKRTPLTDADRARVLQRLIDEELLVQRGIELGLPASDNNVRKALAEAMIAFAMAEAAAREPSEDELRAFYAERPALFARPPLLAVRAAAFPAEAAAAAAAFADALNGGARARGDFAAAVESDGGRTLPLPDGLVPASKLADYAGPSVRDAALRLQPSQAAVIDAPEGRRILVLVDARIDTPPPPFEEVRAAVAAEWRKRVTEQALAGYIARLRDTIPVTLSPDAPR